MTESSSELTRANSPEDGERASDGQRNPHKDDQQDEEQRSDQPDKKRDGHPSPSEGREERIHFAVIISLLIFTTIWGTLARFGMQWIGSFASSVVFPLVWTQILGAFLTGLTASKKPFLDHYTPLLFVAINFGFAASVTTFSTLEFETFQGFANYNLPGASRFTGFTSGLAISFVTIGVSLEAIILGPLFWLGSIFLLVFGPVGWRPTATFSIVLAPPGTLLRYFLSQKLNSINPNFPLGTCTANIFGCLILAITSLLRTSTAIPGGVNFNGCSALIAVEEGFCGALTTVPTLLVELKSIQGSKRKWRYFLASWGAGQLMFVLIFGSWIWSGDRGSLCSA